MALPRTTGGSGTQPSGYGAAVDRSHLWAMVLAAIMALWIRHALCEFRAARFRKRLNDGPKSTDSAGTSTESSPTEVLRLQIGLTDLPQYRRLVRFVEEVEDWTVFVAGAIPGWAEELDSMVKDCREDMAKLQEA